MAERYIRQFAFDNDVYLQSCPVALEKGAVLFDAATDTYNLQLKFANLGAIGIASAKISIQAIGRDGYLAYQEISVLYEEPTAPGGTLGTKKLLPVPNNDALVFRVFVEKLTMVSGHMYVFAKTDYSLASGHNNISAMRNHAAHEAERQRRPLPGSTVWHHGLFVLNTVLLLLVFIILLLTPPPVGWLAMFAPPYGFFMIHAWVSLGTEKVYKRVARMAIFALVVWIPILLLCALIGIYLVGILIVLLVWTFFYCMPFFAIRRKL